MSRLLLQVLVTTFVAVGATVDLVTDETLERRWGRKISKRGHWRDSLASSKGLNVSTSGLGWLVLAVRGGQVTLEPSLLGLTLPECTVNDP